MYKVCYCMFVVCAAGSLVEDTRSCEDREGGESSSSCGAGCPTGITVMNP